MDVCVVDVYTQTAPGVHIPAPFQEHLTLCIGPVGFMVEYCVVL